MACAAPATRFAHGGRQGDFGGELGSESLSTGVLGRAMVSLLVRDFILNLSGVTSTSKGFGNAVGETDLVAGVAGAGVRYPDIRAGEQGSGGCQRNYLNFVRGDHGDRSKTPGRCRQDFRKYLETEISNYL